MEDKNDEERDGNSSDSDHEEQMGETGDNDNQLDKQIWDADEDESG